jgi:hypothetical protein
MNSPGQILDLNIARYRALILAEREPQVLQALRDALDRDLERKKQLRNGNTDDTPPRHEV